MSAPTLTGSNDKTAGNDGPFSVAHVHPADSTLLGVSAAYGFGNIISCAWNGSSLGAPLFTNQYASGATGLKLWSGAPAAGSHNLTVTPDNYVNQNVAAISVSGLASMGTITEAEGSGTTAAITGVGGDADTRWLALFSMRNTTGSARTLSNFSHDTLFTPVDAQPTGQGIYLVAMHTTGADPAFSFDIDSGDNWTAILIPLQGGSSPVPALVFTQQPTTVARGMEIAPDVVVSITTDGSTVDTGATDDVTLAVTTGDSDLVGTLVQTAVAGVATFPGLVPILGSGTHKLTATATGFADVESASFTVSAGSGTTLILGGGAMSGTIRRNEATASLRRIYLSISAPDGTAWAGSVTDVKAQLSVNGAAESPSPADIVRVAGKLHYVELAQPFTDIAEGSRIAARVAADTGRLETEPSVVEIIPGDSYDAPATEAGIAKKVFRANNGLDGFAAAKDPDNNQVVLTIPVDGVVNVPAVFDANSPGVTSIGVAP